MIAGLAAALAAGLALLGGRRLLRARAAQRRAIQELALCDVPLRCVVLDAGVDGFRAAWLIAATQVAARTRCSDPAAASRLAVMLMSECRVALRDGALLRVWVRPGSGPLREDLLALRCELERSTRRMHFAD